MVIALTCRAVTSSRRHWEYPLMKTQYGKKHFWISVSSPTWQLHTVFLAKMSRGIMPNCLVQGGGANSCVCSGSIKPAFLITWGSVWQNGGGALVSTLWQTRVNDHRRRIVSLFWSRVWSSKAFMFNQKRNYALFLTNSDLNFVFAPMSLYLYSFSSFFV